jgi:rhomboid protease GluP
MLLLDAVKPSKFTYSYCVSLITINVVIFTASVFSNSQERVIAVYGFIPNHLFYNEPDAANRIDFDEQKSLPFFSSGFSLETLARLFSSMFIHAGVFHLSWNLFALLYLGGSQKDL